MTWRIPDDLHPGKMREWSFHTTPNNLARSEWSMSKFPHPVTLDWARRPSMEKWNEITAWTIEYFGLPGIRYQTEVSTERMTWYFRDEQDKLMMILAWGDDHRDEK